MLDRLQALFAAGDGAGDTASPDTSALSAAALMLYAARLDGKIDDAECRTVVDLMGTRFGLGSAEA
jgi:hypothetical protein